MARKKLEIEQQILRWFNTAPLEQATLLHGFVNHVLQERRIAWDAATGNRRRTPSVRVPDPPPVAVVIPPVSTAAQEAIRTPTPRKRRMTAASPRPANEATPIVPQQDAVSDNDAVPDYNDAYVGD